jgi:hypothetical protein
MHTTTRHATLDDLAALLRDQQARKVDLVTPASTLRAEEASLRIRGSVPVIGDDGVTSADGLYRPTQVFDEGLATKLSIPRDYLKRLRDDRPDLYDANVNGWLHGRRPLIMAQSPVTGQPEVKRPGIPGDDRSFLIRTFKPDNDEPGIARAILSDRYAVIDHLDALTAALDGVAQAGVNVQITGADLSDRRMTIRVEAPEVTALAPTLLRGYRSPFTGESGTDNPLVFAGFVITNSETGGSAYTITPRLVVQVCRNGMTVTKDAMRAVHLGGRMEEGVIEWSEDTQRKQLDLITARSRDAVATFLNVDYMTGVIMAAEQGAEKPVAKVDDVRDVTKRLRFTTEQTEGILAQFVQGGQMTMGGVMNAVTAYAQTVDDGDEAFDLEAKALSVLS